MAERIQGMSIGLGLDTVQMERGLTGLKDRLKTLNSEMKANLSAFDYAEESVEKYEVKLRGLSNQLEVQKRIVSQSRAEYDKMVQKYGEGSKQAERAATAFNNQVASLNNLQRAYNRTSQNMIALESEQRSLQSGWGKLGRLFDETGAKLNNMGSTMKDVGSNLTASLSLPIAGAGIGITALAKNFDDSSVRISNSLGLTAKETKKLTDTSKRIYEDGYGESLEEIDNALLETKQNITDLNDSDLEKITKKAMTLAKTFDADVNEVTRAGNTLITNYGMDADAAFDLMAKGAQNGMNKSKEMFDNMAEYSISFKEAGFSANEMFAILSNGAKKGYNLDRLNDTMLEFKLQSEDSSDAYLAAVSKMSKGTQQVFADYQNGKATVSDLYKEMLPELEKLRKTLPDKEFNTIGKSLFGTKWEDQGADVVLSMKTINKELQNNKGTMDEMTKNTEQSFGARLQGTLRQAGDALLPFGEILMNVAENIMPKVSSGIETVSNFIKSLSPAVQTAVIIFGGLMAALGPVITIVGMFIGAFSNLLPLFSKVTGAISRAGGLLNVLRLGFTALTGPVGITIGVLTLLGTTFVTLYKKSETFRNFINSVWDSIKNKAVQVFGFLKPYIDQIMSALTEFVQQKLSQIKQFWETNGQQILQVVKNIWGFISSVISSVLTGFIIPVVQKGLNAILAVFKFVFPFALSLVQSVWSNIKGVINGALNIIMGLVKIFSGLFTADFSKMWQGVKQLFSGAVQFIWNFVQLNMFGKLLSLGKVFAGSFKSLFSSLWNGLKSLFSSSVSSVKNFVVNGFNSMKSSTTTILTNLKNSAVNIWQNLKTSVSNFVSQTVNGVKNGWTTAKNKTVEIFNSIKTKVSNTFSDIVEGAKALPGKIGSGIKSMAGKVSEGVKSVSNKLASGLGKGVNGVIDGVNWVLGKVGIKSKDQIPNWKVPAYKKGTEGHQGGLAILGDGKKKELFVTPNGQLGMSPATDTLMNLPKGTRVFSGEQTQQLMRNGLIPRYEKGNVGDWFKEQGQKVKDVAVAAKDKVVSGAKKVKDFSLDVWEYASDPEKLMKKVFAQFVPEMPNTVGVLKGLLTGGLTKVKDGAVDFIKKKLENAGEFLGGGAGFGNGAAYKGSGAAMARAAITQALKMLNKPMSLLSPLMTIAQRESGFNPNAINNWDINARRGDPSIGLFQIIGSTFRRWMYPGHGNRRNPLDSALAAIRYMDGRYGGVMNHPGIKSMMRGGGYKPYKNGTNYHSGGDAILGDGGEYEPFLLPNGLLGLSPDMPTLFSNLPTGTKVWSSVKDFFKQYAGVNQNSKTDAMKILAIAARKLEANSSQSGGSDFTSSRNIQSMSTTDSEALQLLREQNDLLKAILAKESTIDMDSREVGRLVEPHITEFQERNKGNTLKQKYRR